MKEGAMYGRLRRFIKASLVTIAAVSGGLVGLSLPVMAQGQSPVQEVDRTNAAYFYGRYGCGACHGPDGKGTVIGLPIVGRPPGPLTRQQIIRQIRTPTAMMPAYTTERISDERLEQIVEYIGALEKRAAAPAGQSVAAAPVSSQPVKSTLPSVPTIGPADPKTYEMKEYLSTACGAGHSISVAPDGRVWFSGIQRHKLVVFDPKTEAFKCWDIPTELGRPHGIKVDSYGMVWVTVTGLPQNKVTMFDPKTELFTDYYMPYTPQKFMYPHTIVMDNANNPVFSFEYGDAIGRINRTTGQLQIWQVPTHRARPYGLEVAKDGIIWAVEFLGNKIVRIDPKTGAVKEYAHPRLADDPGTRRMALDSQGRLWFGEHEHGSIGMFDPKTETWKSWRAPANGGRPIDIYSFNVDKNDRIWYSHFGGNYIGRFDPKTEKFSLYPHISRPINCRLMDIAADGTLWCMGSGSPNLVRLKVLD
jgi:virginiamycin B lyase